ncbi:pullulanase-type alpha-1,6-glucosidase [Salinispirillum sp. LH 10-3-1]|uniref:Pullulanase-type alpha-1,6-glucosidase n=1 Tax=Salinispirillum sp. LH 10-3-1 TaxID=2952525 RepID=A0AB38YHS1_9GAMM
MSLNRLIASVSWSKPILFFLTLALAACDPESGNANSTDASGATPDATQDADAGTPGTGNTGAKQTIVVPSDGEIEPASGAIVEINTVPDTAAMHWLNAETLLWQGGLDGNWSVRLYHSPAADLVVTSSGVFGTGGYFELQPSSVSGDVSDRFRSLSGDAFALDASLSDDVRKALLKQQLVVVAYDTQGAMRQATQVQIPGVLDDLYATGTGSAVDVDLGVQFVGSDVTFRVWAPTALTVNLKLYDANKALLDSIELTEDMATGVWSTTAFRPDVDRQFFRYEITVFHPDTLALETYEVTDPYALSLSTDSRYSQVVDLQDADLKPAQWDTLSRPTMPDPTDLIIYEAHVRDFSARDTSTPAQYRGTYKAFTLANTAPMQHLQTLADAGLNMIHLLPVNDLGSMIEDPALQVDLNHTVADLCAQRPASFVCAEFSSSQTLLSVFESFDPTTDRAQALVEDMRALDSFNWGYDPYHFFAPEGSYATNPEGVTRIRELRELIASMHDMGLLVALDVVYNHTFQAGLDEKSVLDKVVPGYYHRRNEVTGAIEDTTCCPNTATEWRMMEKLMVDSLVSWAEHYRFDAFRFDLMGHIPRDAVLRARDAVQAVHPTNYFYGEGWNFGEVMDDRRFDQASQLNMAGTHVGTFSDRLREAVRAGDLFTGGGALHQQDVTRIGLVGNVGSYEFRTASNTIERTYDYIWNGQPAGYSADPADTVNYVSKHDNETLWDILQDNLPAGMNTQDRVQAHQVALSYPMLGQGIPFIHMGSELLRSKSMDRDSYDSGDWFNYVDFTRQTNNWNVGLPVREKNEPRYDRIAQIIQNPASQPQPQHIDATYEYFLDLMRIRASSKLFRLSSAADVRDRVRFHNTGSNQIQGLIVKSINDGLGLTDIDPDHDAVVVLFNASGSAQSYSVAEAVGQGFTLHPAHRTSSTAFNAGFDSANGTFTVPARTTAVFVLPQGAEQGIGLGEAAPHSLFLLGEMNGWTHGTAMSYSGNDTYTRLIDLNAGTYAFKIADADWGTQTNSANFSDGGGSVAVMAAGGSDGNLQITVAESGEYRLTLNRSNPGNQIVTVTLVALADDDDDDGQTPGDGNDPVESLVVYFEKPTNWGTAYVHYWNAIPAGSVTNSSWPGVAMTSVGDGWYRYAFDGVSSINVVFNDNGRAQTSDLTRAENGCYQGGVWQRNCDPMSAEERDDGVVIIDPEEPVLPENKVAFVHLFEWSWPDIAQECELHLSDKGFTAVQVSPPQEHIVGNTWWTRYQPVSYQLNSRSGDRAQFIDMVQRCNAVGVEIYADLVINHTADIDTWNPTAGNGVGAGGPVGSGGTEWSRMNHPGLYDVGDYHPECVISNYQNRTEVQECQLSELPDLNTSNEYVQQTLAAYIQDLVDIGVTGFRIDAAKHMAADDIAGIINRVTGDPYFFSEIIDLGNEPIRSSEYLGLGMVEEFIYSREISRVFKTGSLAWLANFGQVWGEFQHAGSDVVVFTDNHDNQRGHGAGGNILTHQEATPGLYDLANVYMLAWPYGYPRIMSSYRFSNTEMGPPAASVHGDQAVNCFGDDWVCEHRWRPIANMVAFRAIAESSPVVNWWDNGANQIAFARDGAGFVAINRETDGVMSVNLPTSLPAGEYCNVLAAEPDDCAGQTLSVNADGELLVTLAPLEALAIHVGARMD